MSTCTGASACIYIYIYIYIYILHRYRRDGNINSSKKVFIICSEFDLVVIINGMH